MRVLITGGAGYIGSHAAKELSRAGHSPVVFDNLSVGHGWAVRWGPFVKGDLSDGALIRATLEEHAIEGVIHFAAHAYVGESITDPRKYFQNNVTNTLSLLDAMLEVGVRFVVFSSSCATYGLPGALPITEDQPQHPINPYGDSKLFVERILKWYGRAYDLRWMVLRFFNAAGADPDLEIGEDHDPETHLIPLAIQAALRLRSHVEIYGTDYPTPDGTAVRDYIHVTDLADAHVRALGHLAAGGESGAVNLGAGLGHSVREVLSAVEAQSGCGIVVHEAPRRPGDPPILVADAERAADVLGWRPQYSQLSEIVRTAWRWETFKAARTQAGERFGER